MGGEAEPSERITDVGINVPQIEFESAESEIDGLSDACVPPSGAQAKSQEASTPMLDFDHRAIIV